MIGLRLRIIVKGQSYFLSNYYNIPLQLIMLFSILLLSIIIITSSFNIHKYKKLSKITLYNPNKANINTSDDCRPYLQSYITPTTLSSRVNNQIYGRYRVRGVGEGMDDGDKLKNMQLWSTSIDEVGEDSGETGQRL